MNKKSLAVIARKIIGKNDYLTLGTYGREHVWVSPVYYGVSNTFTFYFASQLDSVHSKNILKNPNVSFTIFDSTQKEGTGNGVQCSGKAYLLPEKEIDAAMCWYYTSFMPMTRKSFSGKAPYRFFKIIPEHFYILDPNAKFDKRVEVFL